MKQKLDQNLNWQKADQLAIYKAWRTLNTNPSNGTAEELNSGPPDYKFSSLTTRLRHLHSVHFAVFNTYFP